MLLVTEHLYVGQEISETHQQVRNFYAPTGAIAAIDAKIFSSTPRELPNFILSAAEVITPFQPGAPITNPAGPAASAHASPPPVTMQPLQHSPNLPSARLHRTPFPRVAKPEAVLLEGMIATAELGGYSLSYGPGQLMVSVYGSNPRIGGSYAVGGLPAGEWFVLTDRHGSVLPVAVQKIREDAYQVRVDPAPLQGLRAVTSMPGY
jgi:hypothetical protein